MKIITTALFLLSLNVYSYAKNPSFKTLNIGFTDSKGHLEYFPDLYVTYSCANYTRMKGLDMQSNYSTAEVTVNYGGWGRRRGLRDFECLDK